MSTYRSSQVCQAVGITYRQLDFWARMAVVKPEIGASGSGSIRLWSEADVVAIVLASRMRDAGLMLTTAAQAVSALRLHGLRPGWLVVVKGRARITDDLDLDYLSTADGVWVLALQPLYDWVYEVLDRSEIRVSA